MRKCTKSDIFKAAWTMSRQAAEKFGGKAKDCFSESLKLAWARAKKLVWIEAWFVEKKMIANGMKVEIIAEIIKETEKAAYVKTQFGTEEWCPKSVLTSALQVA